MADEKPGAVRLLTEADLHGDNMFGKSLVGWVPTSQGYGGLVNPRGFSALRVVLQKPNPAAGAGAMGDLYDQPMLVENHGAAVVCRAGDRIGVVRNFRMVGPRLLVANPSDYVGTLDRDARWEELFATLGAWRYELPQGIAPKTDDAESLETFVLKTAKIEAGEEGGFHVEDVRIIGRVNASPTFFPHAQYVVEARIVSVGSQQTEDLEIIGGVQLCTSAELRELVREGTLDNALSLAALALAGVSF